MNIVLVKWIQYVYQVYWINFDYSNFIKGSCIIVKGNLSRWKSKNVFRCLQLNFIPYWFECELTKTINFLNKSTANQRAGSNLYVHHVQSFCRCMFIFTKRCVSNSRILILLCSRNSRRKSVHTGSGWCAIKAAVKYLVGIVHKLCESLRCHTYDL